MAIIINNTIFYTSKLLRYYMSNVLTTRKDNYMIEVFANATAIVILQYIHASSQLLHTLNLDDVIC